MERDRVRQLPLCVKEGLIKSISIKIWEVLK